jgi:hypothetical protein
MAPSELEALNQVLAARGLYNGGKNDLIQVGDTIDKVALFLDILETIRPTTFGISRVLAARLRLSYGDLCIKKSENDGDHHVALTIEEPTVVKFARDDILAFRASGVWQCSSCSNILVFSESLGNFGDANFLGLTSRAVCLWSLGIPEHLMFSCETFDAICPPGVYQLPCIAWPPQLLRCTENTKELPITPGRPQTTSRVRDAHKAFWSSMLIVTDGVQPELRISDCGHHFLLAGPWQTIGDGDENFLAAPSLEALKDYVPCRVHGGRSVQH